MSTSERAGLTLRGVLFDLDGTLVNSEPFWAAAQTRLVHAFGGRWRDEDAKALTGRAPTTITGALRSAGVDLEDATILERLLDDVIAQLRGSVTWMPGADALLTEVKAGGLRTALVTMSPRSVVDVVLDALPSGYFDAVVCLDDVQHVKPHPEAYTLALTRLGLHADEVVAFEDSAPGVGSAVAAGVITITVTQSARAAEHAGVLIQPTLQGVPLDRVRGPHRSRSQDRSDARGRVLRAGRDAVGGVVVARDHPDAPAVRSAG